LLPGAYPTTRRELIMEGGSDAVAWVMRCVLWIVIAGMAYLFVRAMRFFLSMLLIPVASMLADVAPGLARRLDAWATKALAREPTSGRITPGSGDEGDPS
jgi:hypothetical protein